MSASNSKQPTDGPQEATGLGGLAKRVRSALTKSKSSYNMSSVPTVPAEEPVSTALNTVAPETGSTSTDTANRSTETRESSKVTTTETPTKYKVTRRQLWEERAQQIFEKYELSLDPSMKLVDPAVDLTATVERVKKPVRMRVHLYCHRCEACFGPDRICASCEHRKCKKCTRHPREEAKARDNSVARRAKTKKEEQHSMAMEPLVIIQNPQTGRQILVHNRAGYHTRRSCHKCDAEFVPPMTKMCSGCGHTRCARCPRLPATTTRWKAAYPGEAEGSSEEEQLPHFRHMRQERVFRKPRQRVRWNCDHCSALFSEGQKTCQDCGHDKCPKCRRQP